MTGPDPHSITPAQPATRVRWIVLAMLFAGTTVNFADRATLSIAGADLRTARA